MTTLLFCTSYIDSPRAWEERYQRWLRYYQQGRLQADLLAMIDDGASHVPEVPGLCLAGDDGALPARCDGLLLYRFAERLGRPRVDHYPGWWRSFFKSLDLAEHFGADKIVHVESDAFLLTQRAFDCVNEARTGWHVMWCAHYGFPETAIQVICQDQFGALRDFRRRYESEGASDLAERILPFTHVHREFVGDRYSELIRIHRGIFRSRKFDRFKIFKSNRIFRYMPLDADYVTQLEPWQDLAASPATRPL